MKQRYFLIGLITLMTCSDRNQGDPAPQPTEIDGLELTFIETNLTEPTTTLEFIDETTGFTADYEGNIFKTTNGGAFWTKVGPKSVSPIMSIRFINDKKGFAVGGSTSCSGSNCTPTGALMLRTLDGGESWTNVPISTKDPVNLVSIHFVDELNGFVVGSFSILRTKDGGETWSETVVENPGATLVNVRFFDANNGIVTGIFNKVFKTDNGGDTWTPVGLYDDFSAFALSVNGNSAFSSHDTHIHRTVDEGQNWNPVYTFDLASIWSLNFVSETTGFAFGSGEWSGGDFGHSLGAIYYTRDAGQSWTGTNKAHEVDALVNSSFPTPTTGYAIGYRSFVKIRLR